MGVAMLDDGPNWFSGWCRCGRSEFNSASERKQFTKEIKLAGSSIYKKESYSYHWFFFSRDKSIDIGQIVLARSNFIHTS